jgi:hypothetical protein
MARPRKIGLEYFPLDVLLDEKVEYIETLYEAEGFYLWIKLLQRIYATGYYIEWSKYQAAAMKKQTGISLEKIDEILKSCLEVGLFDQELYDRYSIITSRGIQKRFCMATAKRKEIEIVPEYVLHDKLLQWIDGENSGKTPVNSSKNGVDDGVNSEKTQRKEVNNKGFSGINPEETTQEEALLTDYGSQSAGDCRNNTEISTQSKVKESKVKKSKKRKKETRAPAQPKHSYAEHVTLTETEYQKIVDELGDAGAKWVVEYLNDYKIGYGKEKAYKSDYHVMRNWVITAYRERLAKGQIPVGKEKVEKKVEDELAKRDWSNW